MAEEDKGQNEGEQPETDGSESSEEPTVESLTAELEESQATIRKLRRWERKAKSLEKKLAEQGNGDGGEQAPPPANQPQITPEVEKLRAQLAEAQARENALQQERVDALVKAAVVGQAGHAGFEHPEDVYRVIDLSEIEYDEETGEIHGVADEVKRIAKERPRWMKSAGVGVGTGQGGRTETDDQMRARLFGRGGANDFWKGSGVHINQE